MSDSILSKLHELEVRCISGDFENFDFSPASDQLKTLHSDSTVINVFENIVTLLTQHEYRQVLEVPLSEIGLRYNEEDGLLHYEKESSDPEAALIYLKDLVLLFVGVSALQEFVRANICGPVRKEEDLSPVVYLEPRSFCAGEDKVRKYLCKDGEFAMNSVILSKLLHMSSVFLSSSSGQCLTRKWWLMRCIMIHQRILPEKIASMHEEMDALVRDILQMGWINEKKHSSHLLLFQMEREQMYLYFQRVNSARDCLVVARELSGLTVELGGAYGKRTQFQQKPVPQLFVKLRCNGKDRINQTTGKSDFPPDLPLQDDTLLNNVTFIDGEKVVQDLTPEEQLVLFGECSYLRLGGAADNLQKEETLSYIYCMLSQQKVWSVYVSALVLRCKYEKSSTRHMDRSLRQLETLIEYIKKDAPGFKSRISMLYAVAFPMLWSLEKVLADLLMEMGAVKTALDVYKRLDLWEDVVVCYQHLGRTSDAVEVIKEKLKTEETPLLYCLLGDVLDDPKMYEKANDLSPTPNARSQRSLGYYHYRRKDYLECMPYFQKSVQINYLQAGVWFALGYAALQCEQYEYAAEVYRRVVMFDDENFQAWNNLSHAYIKCGQKKRAWKSLQEALKCNYEEWKVWENFLVVCVDVGAFEDAIRAYHRLIDIKEKYTDIEVLEILVKAINTDVDDIYGNPASRLKGSLQKLFGRVTSVVRKEYKIWELYSMLLCPDPDSPTDIEIMDTAASYQQKAAVGCSSSDDKWPSDASTFKTVLKTCLRNVRLFSSLIQMMEDNKAKAEKKTVVKVMTKGILTRAESGLINFEDPEKSELKELLESVKSIYDKILEL